VASTGPGELLYAETSRESRACGNSDAGPPQALTAFVSIWACNATCQFSDAAWTAAKALTTIAAATRHLAADIGVGGRTAHEGAEPRPLCPRHCLVPGGGTSPDADRWVRCYQSSYRCVCRRTCSCAYSLTAYSACTAGRCSPSTPCRRGRRIQNASGTSGERLVSASTRSRSLGFDINRSSSVPSDLRTHSFSVLNTSDRPLLAVFEARFWFRSSLRAVATPWTCIS
jgi:hypothetical protein